MRFPGDFASLALALRMKVLVYELNADETETIQVDESFFKRIPEIFNSKKILTAGIFDLDNVKDVKAAKFDFSGSVMNLVRVEKDDGSSRTAVGGILGSPVLFENSDLEDLLKEEKLQGQKNSEYLELLVAKAANAKSLEDPEFETLQLFMVSF